MTDIFIIMDMNLVYLCCNKTYVIVLNKLGTVDNVTKFQVERIYNTVNNEEEVLSIDVGYYRGKAITYSCGEILYNIPCYKTIKEAIDNKDTTYYDNGQIQSQDLIIDNTTQHSEWYKNGQLMCQYSHINGKKNGLYKQWNSVGELVCENMYFDDVFAKKHTEYYLNADYYRTSKKQEWYTINGDAHGEFRVWYENLKSKNPDEDVGKIKQISMYDYGMYVGVSNVWHENGQLKCLYNYINDKQNGEYREWYENGQLKCLYNYRMDKLDGEQKHWHENGQLSIECSCIMGKFDGEHKRWHNNGQLMIECYHTDGKRNGLYKEYNKDGKVVYEMQYIMGTPQNWFYKSLNNIKNFMKPSTHTVSNEEVNLVTNNDCNTSGTLFPPQRYDKIPVLNVHVD